MTIEQFWKVYPQKINFGSFGDILGYEEAKQSVMAKIFLEIQNYSIVGLKGCPIEILRARIKAPRNGAYEHFINEGIEMGAFKAVGSGDSSYSEMLTFV